VAHGGERPNGDGNSVADFGSQPINDAGGEEQTDTVSELEGLDDVLVIVVEDNLVGVVENGFPAHKGSVWRSGSMRESAERSM